LVAPLSFAVDWPYVDRLLQTKESWLQQLFLGIALRQQGNEAAAVAALNRSVALRPELNPMALSLLGRHGEAWDQLVAGRLRAHKELAMDIADSWVASLVDRTSVSAALPAALASFASHGISTQQIRSASVAELIYGRAEAVTKDRCTQAINLLLTSEWAVSDKNLVTYWEDAWYCVDGAPVDDVIGQHRSRLAHPPPRFIDFAGAT